MKHSGRPVIKFRCHHKTGFPSTRQARVFLPGHGSHVFDWPFETARIDRELPGGLTLTATRSEEHEYDCRVVDYLGRTMVPMTRLHYVGETEAPNSEQTYSGD